MRPRLMLLRPQLAKLLVVVALAAATAKVALLQAEQLTTDLVALLECSGLVGNLPTAVLDAMDHHIHPGLCHH